MIMLSVSMLAVTGCKKKIPGCMDQNAENFDVEATEDAGTCSYRGSVAFYHTQETCEHLIADGVTNVKLYVDGVFKDAMSPYVQFGYVPECGHDETMNMDNYGLGNYKSQTFNYDIKDQNGIVLEQGTFEIEGNKCKAIEYTY